MRNLLISLLIGTFLFNIIHLKAQQIVQIEPLFEYPVAPDDLETLTDRTNYLVTHFWEQLDTKNQQPVNQIALNDAFQTYLTYVRYSEEKVSLQSIDKLISSINNNPTLLVQFTKAAEENLYGPRAEIWADDIYLKFLDASLKNKKVSQTRKEKFQSRVDLIRRNIVGHDASPFDFINPENQTEKYFPMSTPTLIIFGDPEDMDWRLERLRMESNTALNQAIDKGKLNIIFIDVSDNPDWINSVSNYSSKWKVGNASGIKDIYDIRILPAIYLINSKGKIEMKNRPVELSVNKALEISGL